MKEFIAIDVETANFSPSSICAVGAAKVRDGLVVDTRYTLVQPEPNYYSRRCVAVHGLTDDDTWNAPCFGTVWKELDAWMRADLPDGAEPMLVAHNAGFDSRCIAEACRIYGLEAPVMWADTLAAARKAIPRGMLASKSLDSLCAFFGIPLEKHHCALDDAVACAKLGIILLDEA
ncbi:MAG: 3'-5' exoribonuclease [Muribaculaceae bacterium]|nr:3'-5' exoribonuclease [Muribaculaceae bacterium]